MRKTWLPWLILSPSLLFLLLFTWFPLGRSVYDSLFDTRMASDGAQYVGLDNFARLFADNVFWQSLGNNLLYILLTVVPGVTLALLLAVAVAVCCSAGGVWLAFYLDSAPAPTIVVLFTALFVVAFVASTIRDSRKQKTSATISGGG